MEAHGHTDCDPVFLTLFGRTRRGVKGTVVVSPPAAGAEWSQSVPGGEQWRVLTGQALFTAGAAVANRTPRVRITDGTAVLFETPAPTQVAAAGTLRVSLQPEVASQPVAQGIAAQILGIPLMWLPPGFVIQSITDALQPADQYSNVRLFVERVFEVDTDLTDEHYRRLEAYEAMASQPRRR